MIALQRNDLPTKLRMFAIARTLPARKIAVNLSTLTQSVSLTNHKRQQRCMPNSNVFSRGNECHYVYYLCLFLILFILLSFTNRKLYFYVL